MNYKEFLLEKINSGNIKVLNRCFQTSPDLVKFLCDETKYIPSNINNNSQRLYHWFHGICSIPECEICGNNKKYITFFAGYKCKAKCERQIEYNRSVTKFAILSRDEILKQYYNLLESYSKTHIQKVIQCNYIELHHNIIRLTMFCNDNSKLTERIYCIEHNISKPVLCIECNKNVVAFFVHDNKYRDFCSYKCAAKNENTASKRTETSNKKFGEDNYMNRKSAHDTLRKLLLDDDYKKEYCNKNKLTKLERYGNENYVNSDKRHQTELAKHGMLFVHTDEFKKKSKKTKLRKYGDENYVNIEQAKITKCRKYGDENYVNMEQIKNTKLSRYGDANYNNAAQISDTRLNFSDEKNLHINNKRIETNVERYGVQFSLQREDVKEQIKNTCIEKYGVESVLQLDQCRTNGKHQVYVDTYNRLSRFSDIVVPLFDVEDYKGSNNTITYDWKCVKCGDKFSDTYENGVAPRCLKCFPILNGISAPEVEIMEFINSFGLSIITNSRQIISPLELDIYLPDNKLAIEFDGLYWHSELAGKDNSYHLQKTKLCEQQGIQLLHIFENEWQYKSDIVKSIIQSKIGKCETIYARKCILRELNNTEKSLFLLDNHIQGDDRSSVKLGLFYNDELVSLMTFGKSRYNKRYEYEILRFCNKKFTNVVGGASKLLTYFERNYKPNSLITYADMRYSNGNLYKQLGFEHADTSTPNYFYFRGSDLLLHSRVKFQKHKLHNILDKFDPELTECENMKNNGWNRIWDCGNLVFVKSYTNEVT
jgi:very-short-patch-repair endonuclease